MRVRSAFRAATATISAVAVLAALDVATAADFAPWELPGTTDADRAASAALQLRNRARLRSLAARTNASLPRLCGGPFGPPGAAPLRLLHIPKTGSTFTTTFLRHACPAMPLDAAMGTRIPRDRRWVLDGRRNVADYDAMSLLRLFNASCPGDARLPLGNRSVCRARDMPASKVVTCRPDPTYRAQRQIHHQEFNPRDEDPATVASFFRAPNDRLLSAYHFGLHAWGLSSVERKALEAAVDSPAAFARYPGVAGCAARLLNSCTCGARDAPLDDGNRTWKCDARPNNKHYVAKERAVVDRAMTAVRRLGFVGITELHAASVCVFHRLFGGAPRDDEFAKYRVGGGHDAPGAAYDRSRGHNRDRSNVAATTAAVGYGESAADAALDHFVDPLDEAVFAAALDRFEDQLARALNAAAEAKLRATG